MNTSTLRRVLAAGALAALPAAAGAQEPAGVPCQETYTVASGETLVSVAARCDVTVWALIRVNPGLNTDGHLPAGQSLRIPHGRGLTDADVGPRAMRRGDAGLTVRHVVSAGQTLGEIAGLYGTPVSEILRVNRIPDPNVLSVGMELTIPPPARSILSPTPAEADVPAVPTQATARPHADAAAADPAAADPEATPEPAEAAEPAAPRVMVGHPEAGTAGPLEIHASGLPPGATAQVGLGPAGGAHRVVQTATVDERGRIEVQVAVPDWVDRSARYVVVVEVPGQAARAVSPQFRVGGSPDR